MKLTELMKVVSEAYDLDGTVAQCIDDETGMPLDRDKRNVGDTLAEFVACEIAETFDPTAEDAYQLDEAHNRMDSARRQLEQVLTALENREPNA